MYEIIYNIFMISYIGGFAMQNEKQRKNLLRRLTGEIGALYHEAAVKVGISDSVQIILYIICENGDRCLQSDIYRQTGINRQTINSAIHKLEKEDIIRIEQGTGRNTIVCLTENGKKFAEEKAYVLFEIEDNIFNEWTEEEQEEYVRLNQKFRDSLKRQMELRL